MRTQNLEKAVTRMLNAARSKSMEGSGFGIMLSYYPENEEFEVSSWVTQNTIPNPNSGEVKIYWQPAWSGRFDQAYKAWKESLIEEIKVKLMYL